MKSGAGMGIVPMVFSLDIVTYGLTGGKKN